MSTKWPERVILIGFIIALAVAFLILAATGTESACGTPGDIECPGGPPKPYPGPGPTPPYVPTSEVPDPYPPPTADSMTWYRAWLPAIFGGE
jgi:hypothetical protein